MKKKVEVEEDVEDRDFDYEQAQFLIELSNDVKKMGFVPMSNLMKSLIEEAYNSDEDFQREFIYEMIDDWFACKNLKKA